jgi:hypothetical protein
VVEILLTFCTRPEGKYQAPESLFTLGPPDMPIDSIEVKRGPNGTFVGWYKPYKRLAVMGDVLNQAHASVSCSWNNRQISELKASIMNGLRQKELIDCRRGLVGSFVEDDDDPATAFTHFVIPGSWGFAYYVGVCRRVTHEAPYIPEK